MDIDDRWTSLSAFGSSVCLQGLGKLACLSPRSFWIFVIITSESVESIRAGADYGKDFKTRLHSRRTL